MRDLVECWALGSPPRWVKPARVAWLAARGLTDAQGHPTDAGHAAVLAAGAAIVLGPDPERHLRELGYTPAWNGFRLTVLELSESGRITYTRVHTRLGPVVLPIATVGGLVAC